jgi:hypothetical protein
VLPDWTRNIILHLINIVFSFQSYYTLLLQIINRITVLHDFTSVLYIRFDTTVIAKWQKSISEDLTWEGKGKVVPVLNYAPRHEDVLRSGGIDPRILDLGTRWRWVVSFTPRSLYLQGKSPLYPLDRRLGGPQMRSGHGVKEKISQPRRESKDISKERRNTSQSGVEMKQ